MILSWKCSGVCYTDALGHADWEVWHVGGERGDVVH